MWWNPAHRGRTHRGRTHLDTHPRSWWNAPRFSRNHPEICRAQHRCRTRPQVEPNSPRSGWNPPKIQRPAFSAPEARCVRPGHIRKSWGNFVRPNDALFPLPTTDTDRQTSADLHRSVRARKSAADHRRLDGRPDEQRRRERERDAPSSARPTRRRGIPRRGGLGEAGKEPDTARAVSFSALANCPPRPRPETPINKGPILAIDLPARTAPRNQQSGRSRNLRLCSYCATAFRRGLPFFRRRLHPCQWRQPGQPGSAPARPPPRPAPRPSGRWPPGQQGMSPATHRIHRSPRHPTRG